MRRQTKDMIRLLQETINPIIFITLLNVQPSIQGKLRDRALPANEHILWPVALQAAAQIAMQQT
jgi:hypothetical protein